MTQLVSIIVPVYNAEKKLPQCIESIIGQTYKNFELLLINDGSKDKSLDICQHYASIDNRIKVFNKTNEGVSIARNLGIKHAKGEWISFIDSDDWVTPNYLENIMNQENIADLTFWGNSCHFPDKSQTQFIPAYFYSKNKNDIENELYLLKKNSQKYEYLGFTWNKLFKTEIIKKHKILFVKKLTIREDEIFTLNYAKYIESLEVKNISSYNYSISNTGLTYSPKAIEEYLIYAEAINNEILQYNNRKLRDIEFIYILEHLTQALLLTNLFSRKWFEVSKYLKKYGNTNISKEVYSGKLKKLFRYKHPLYFYLALWLFYTKNKRR